MQRRTFLTTVSASLAGTLVGSAGRVLRADDQATSAPKGKTKTYRVGIIGSTGRGDYGHALDGVWSKVPGVQIVAVADADVQGREAAGKRLQVDKLYDDYRQMLAREKFDVVCVCPRWLDQREEMITAVAGAGCHIFCEKPFAVDAASADRMLAACRSAGVKVAVAHPQRATPGTREIQARLADGRLGKLLSWRACGKEDHRAGGEDMMVLGCHTFDLMNLLAGAPRWAAAEVLQDGRPVTRSDARQASESIGPIAGNSIAAMFGFADGVDGTYESKAAAADPKAGRRNQIEITCSQGVVLINEGTMEQYVLGDPPFSPAKQQSWELLGPPEWRTMKPPERFAQCKLRIAEDLLRAIEEDREPLTSGGAAAVAIEMIQAVYAAHLAGSRLAMPLAQREHPLGQHAQN